MKTGTIAAPILALSLALGGGTAHAFDLPKILSIGGSNSSGASVNAAEVAINLRNALYAFAKANTGLAAALGGYTELAAQQKLLEGMKNGDAAASKDQLQTLTTIHKSASEAISAKVASNAQLDAEQKKLAGASMVEYVQGLVSTKQVVSSVEEVTKNPTSYVMEAGTLLYAASEMPSIVTSGVSSTSTLIQYLSANGVDVSEAKAAADGLGK